MTSEDLSQFWYCPKDKIKLQNYIDRVSKESYFSVSRRHLDIGIQNAVALRKIPPEATSQTMALLDYIFSLDPSIDTVELVGVICPSCGTRYSAPKVGRVEDVVNTAKVLYETTQSLQTKQYGYFRFVDHFGMGQRRDTQNQQGTMGFRSLWWMVWMFGIRSVVGVLLLYYIAGLEMRVGKRWIPLGPILIFGGMMAILVIFLLFSGGFMFFFR